MSKLKELVSRLRLPLIQAPMAGGSCPPELVAAVARAGCVASFGFAYTPPSAIKTQLKEVRARTTGVINANFFVVPEKVPLPDSAQRLAALGALQNIHGVNNVHLKLPSEPFVSPLSQQLGAMWANPPDIVTFHFGLPPSSALARARELGVCVGVTATSVKDGRLIEEVGADFIVAQGIEAGGHRGTFDEFGADDEQLSCLELVHQLKRQLSTPLVAAGGIMDGTDAHDFITVGATAVQCGTAFLSCHESGASEEHKKYLLAATERGTRYTAGFSGRMAQGIRNRFMDQMEGKPTLPFPLQNTMTGAIRAAAVRDNDGENQSLWAGSNYGRSRGLSVSELVQQFQREYENASSKKLLNVHIGSVDFGAVCAAVERGNRIVDVRSRDEYNSGHIPGAINVPVADIQQEFSLSGQDFRAKYGVEKPSRGKEFITSCKMGGRAEKARVKLMEMGYSCVRVYTGSFVDWETNGGTIKK